MTSTACSMPRMKDLITDRNSSEHNLLRATSEAHLESPNGFDSKNSLKIELIISGFLAAMVKVISTGYDRSYDGFRKLCKLKNKIAFLPENKTQDVSTVKN